MLLQYDGSWTGLLTLIFEVYEYNWKQVKITKADMPAQATLFRQDKAIVVTIPSKAKRLWVGLAKLIHRTALRDLYCNFLSGLPGSEETILAAIRFYFENGKNAHLAYGNKDVLRIRQVAKIVDREKHRMKAFIRFIKLEDGLFFAIIEPDFNVIPLIIKHFKDRYIDQKWLIYDVKRSYGIFYNLATVEEVEFTKQEDTCPSVFLNLQHSEEHMYQTLWKRYFERVNIKERKNKKLHLKHVPKRYWKYLIEKQE